MKGVSRLPPTVMWESEWWEGSRSQQKHIVKRWSNKRRTLQTTMEEMAERLLRWNVGWCTGQVCSLMGWWYFLSHICNRVCVCPSIGHQGLSHFHSSHSISVLGWSSHQWFVIFSGVMNGTDHWRNGVYFSLSETLWRYGASFTSNEIHMAWRSAAAELWSGRLNPEPGNGAVREAF